MMNDFITVVKAAADINNLTQCSCPKCNGIVFVKVNAFDEKIQGCCESCGTYWIEDGETNAE